jgi:hypothetical protein
MSLPAAPAPRRARGLDGQIVPLRDQSIRVRSALGAPWTDLSPAVRFHRVAAAAEPFVETDTAEARLAQRHKRVLLDPAAEASGLGVAHHLTRVADRLQIAGDDFVER